MAYVKKYATDEERRLALSRAAKSRKHCRGGRPKGSVNRNIPPKVPTRTLTIREPDYHVVVKMAHALNVPMIEFLHRAAEAWKSRNAFLFVQERALSV